MYIILPHRSDFLLIIISFSKLTKNRTRRTGRTCSPWKRITLCIVNIDSHLNLKICPPSRCTNLSFSGSACITCSTSASLLVRPFVDRLAGIEFVVYYHKIIFCHPFHITVALHYPSSKGCLVSYQYLKILLFSTKTVEYKTLIGD